jgi:hypothetical protein
MAEIGYDDEAAGVRYVSTGHLPAAEDVQQAVEEAYQRYRELPGGRRRSTRPWPACRLGCSVFASPGPAAAFTR